MYILVFNPTSFQEIGLAKKFILFMSNLFAEIRNELCSCIPSKVFGAKLRKIRTVQFLFEAVFLNKASLPSLMLQIHEMYLLVRKCF